MLKNFLITAWRNLLKNKIYTILNVGGLGAGVAVCLLIAVWLKREVSYDDFYSDGKKIFRIVNTFKSQSETFSQAPSGVALGAQLPKLMGEITAGCRVFNFDYKFRAGDRQFFESNIYVVDSNFFSFFAFPLLDGDLVSALNGPDKLVLSEQMAIKYFGTARSIVGKTIMMDDRPMTVAAVASNPPINTHLQYRILVPYSNFRNRMMIQTKEDPDNEWVGGWPYTYVKLLNPGQWKQVEQKVNSIVAKYSEKVWKENNMSYRYDLQPISDIHLKSHLRYDSPSNGSLSSVKIFSVICIIVLLLACINYINLTTAGAIKRAKESSVRKVIGATMWQLRIQFFLETFIICALAVVLGSVLFKAMLPVFSALIGQPYVFKFSTVNILILVAFVLAIAVISGIYPSTVLSSFNPVVSLKGNFSQNRASNFIRQVLVVCQFTITIALISSILVITRQMNFIKNRSLGFESRAVIQINFNNDASVVRHYPALRNQLLSDPSILNVSRHEANVIGGLGNGWTKTVNNKGEEVSTSIYRLNVDADYFDTYNMKLAAGRFFSKEMSTDSAKAVLVNESAVRTFGWPSPAAAIGKPFGDGDDKKYVVGVLKDFNFESLHKPVDALLIAYARAGGNDLSVKIDAAAIDHAVDHIKKTWAALIPDVPLEYAFVDESIGQQYGKEQKMEDIFYGFAGLSLLIACLGLFGLTTFVVERRIKEIGIRKVLGASVAEIVSLLSKDFLSLVFLSILIAAPLGWIFMNNWLKDFAYRVNLSWWVFLLAGTLAAVIALLTVSVQAVRAALANPSISLRAE